MKFNNKKAPSPCPPQRGGNYFNKKGECYSPLVYCINLLFTCLTQVF